MKRSSRSRWRLAGTMAAVCVGLFVQSGRAAERAREFVAGLRERGYYDTAIEYLEVVKNNPNVDAEFKQSIDYEAGVILIEMSRSGQAKAVREKTLADAWERFDKFLKQHERHPKADAARTQLANLLVERGRLKVDLSDNPRNSSEKKEKLRSEARELYEQAKGIFKELEDKCLKAHRKFPKLIPKGDTEQQEARDEVRRNLLQNRLLIASVTAELAKTYKPGSEGYKREMNAAAAKYKEFYEKYGTRGILAGFYARAWEAECYKNLKEPKKAWETLTDLDELSDDIPAFRTAKNKGRALQMEVGVDPKLKKYKECVGIYEEWDKVSAGERKTPDGLTIQYFGGKAKFFRATKDTDEELTDKIKKKLLIEAKKHFQYVAREPGDHQANAKKALIELSGAKPPEDEDDTPTTFVEAFNAAKDEMNLLQDPKLDDAKKAEIQQKVIDFFRLALRLKTDKTTVNELNVVRYYLTYMYYTTGRYYEAAIVGEFLATRYPEGVGAKQGSKIAMASYLNLYNEASKKKDETAKADSGFESRGLERVAKYIANRWAGQPEADEAWMMLVRNAVIEGDLGKALINLQKVPEKSPRRGEAELMTGQAIWSAYLKESDKPEGERPEQGRLDMMKLRAQQTLEAGIDRMQKTEQVDYTLVASILSLAQIYIGSGQPEKAIEWLDKPKIGAMTLVKKKDPVTNRGSFRTETYKAALRAYVSMQQLDKAEDAMLGLEKSIGKGDAAKLTKIYISLGRQLEKARDRLRNEGKPNEASKVERGLELFMTKISTRAKGNTFSSLNWVAETFLRRAQENVILTEGKELSKDAKDYYEKAAATYAKILELCEADPAFAPSPNAPASIRIRRARCLRQLGKYKEAMDLLVEILKKSPTMVDGQKEAAYTYQAQGQENADWYLLAIKGGRKAKKEGRIILLVWGWGKIATRVIKSEKHQGVFYEARYNLALCRFRRAQKLTGSQRTETLNQAVKDIRALHMIRPLLGKEVPPKKEDPAYGAWYAKYGAAYEEWYAKYGYEAFDELLKKIQKQQNVEPVGLKAFQSKAEPEEKDTPAKQPASK